MMQRYFFSILLLVFSSSLLFSQDKSKDKPRQSLVKSDEEKAKELAQKAPITSYKIITLQRDTTFVDTSLTIKKEYDYNYLRRDYFGLMPFANEGQTYNTLNFSLVKANPFPEFGYKGKHFGYLGVNDIKYYSVATPLTELYFKTVMEQGQNVDAFVTVNTTERFNFSIAFKGLRSLGKYINQLSSTGNFRFTTSYFTKDNRYSINFHYTGQDILNGENGGLTIPSDFEDGDKLYKNRARLQVYLKDAKTLLKGKRFFFDHALRINSKDAQNNLYITHQLNYEHKFFEFNQVTVGSTIGTSSTTFNRFGDSGLSSNIIDQNFYDMFYNKVGALYENKTLGKLGFFIENFNSNSYYADDLVVNGVTYAKSFKSSLNAVGGSYEYRKDKMKALITASNSISTKSMRNIDGTVNYKLNDKNNFSFQYQNISKLPDNNFNLHQSTYNNYNWQNDFNNEKINTITATATTQWADASLQLSTLDDHLYFKDVSQNTNNQQLITPHQYSGTIKYMSFKIAKEFKYGKWGLDNTFLFQKVSQKDSILNVPDYVLRNTLYRSGEMFNKAMFFQTGVTLNYFSKYYANGYNPVLGEFFVQNNQKVGGFPLLDLFFNARIRQTRIYFKAEHLNAAFSGNKYYSAPDYPYRDFMIRFGLVWNFFQ